MDTTAVTQLGQQLNDFLVKQFAPPLGTKTSLGFLGTGIGVEPNSFLSGGQFNAARVNQWLDVVVDPLGKVSTSSNQAEFTPWTATQLLEAIYSQAMSLDPLGSEAQQGFARAKSLAMEGLGGATTVSSAPLDWYDPAQVAQWPTCSLTASSTSSSASSSGTGQVPPARPLWAWRRLAPIQTVNNNAVAAAPAETGGALRTINSVQNRRIAFAAMVARPPIAMVARSPIMSERATPIGPAGAAAHAVQVSEVSTASQIAVARFPSSFVSERPVTPAQALIVSHAVSTAASQATTSSVASTSLTLQLKYRVVSLSRAPWWNEFLLLLNNWYIPGLDRATMIEDSDGQQVIGVPIALVLTSDVSIESTWSDADRAAATSSTHFGPWSLDSSHFTATSDAGKAFLVLAGMQAIACIYRQLPALPPKADPSLPVSTTNPSASGSAGSNSPGTTTTGSGTSSSGASTQPPSGSSDPTAGSSGAAGNTTGAAATGSGTGTSDTSAAAANSDTPGGSSGSQGSAPG